MADEIVDRIIVIFVVQGIIRLQDRRLAEVAFKGRKKISRQVIEIRIIRAIERSSPCYGKIKCGFFIDGIDIVQTGILDVIGQIRIFVQVGIFPFRKKGKPREIFVYVEVQVLELILFGKPILKKVAGHVLGKGKRKGVSRQR